MLGWGIRYFIRISEFGALRLCYDRRSRLYREGEANVHDRFTITETNQVLAISGYQGRDFVSRPSWTSLTILVEQFLNNCFENFDLGKNGNIFLMTEDDCIKCSYRISVRDVGCQCITHCILGQNKNVSKHRIVGVQLLPDLYCDGVRNPDPMLPLLWGLDVCCQISN